MEIASLYSLCSESVLVSLVLKNAGVRAPLTVALLKLHSSLHNEDAGK